MTGFLDRYRNGEHAQVWADLQALETRVLVPPFADEARAVARETMTRANHNLGLILPRLRAMGYRFARPDDAWRPPDWNSPGRIDATERRCGPLPLSIRAWYEIVGSVDLCGAHPNLSMYRGLDWAGSDRFYDLHWCSDPLVMFPLDPNDGLDDTWFGDDGVERPAPPFKLSLAPDAIHKARISGGTAMAITLPNAAMDAPLLGSDWEGTTFVSYLRTCFAWGGFPGLGVAFPWSWTAPDPSGSATELGVLRQGLLPL